MAYSITHRSGAAEGDPPGDALDALVGELDRVDPEHPDVAVSHESGWTLSAFPSGRVVFENVEDVGAGAREIVVDRTVVREMFGALAAGDLPRLETWPWRRHRSG